MKAAVVGEHGVEIRDLPKPEPKPNEVLIGWNQQGRPGKDGANGTNGSNGTSAPPQAVISVLGGALQNMLRPELTDLQHSIAALQATHRQMAELLPPSGLRERGAA